VSRRTREVMSSLACEWLGCASTMRHGDERDCPVVKPRAHVTRGARPRGEHVATRLWQIGSAGAAGEGRARSRVHTTPARAPGWGRIGDRVPARLTSSRHARRAAGRPTSPRGKPTPRRTIRVWGQRPVDPESIWNSTTAAGPAAPRRRCDRMDAVGQYVRLSPTRSSRLERERVAAGLRRSWARRVANRPSHVENRLTVMAVLLVDRCQTTTAREPMPTHADSACSRAPALPGGERVRGRHAYSLRLRQRDPPTRRVLPAGRQPRDEDRAAARCQGRALNADPDRGAAADRQAAGPRRAGAVRPKTHLTAEAPLEPARGRHHPTKAPSRADGVDVRPRRTPDRARPPVLTHVC
jgi:hypothetical protein